MGLSLLHHHLFVLLSVVLVAARATLPPHPSGTIDAGSKGEDVFVHQFLDDGVGKARPFFYKYDQQPLDDGVGEGRPFFYKYNQQPLEDSVGKGRFFFYKYDQQPLREGKKLQFLAWQKTTGGPNDEGWFLLEQDLKAGHRVKLDFITQDDVVQRPFLPPQLAKSIPFSTTKFDEILNSLNVEPGSHDAEIMKQNIMDCEAAAIKGEHKHCATSLESMVGFATSRIGEEVEGLSTKVVKKETTSSSGKKEYKISSGGVKKVADNTVVGCHRMEYPYAIYYCHKTEMTRAYTVPLEGDDGVRVKAIAVCHTDTSQWNPNHIAFQLLKVKPGTVPICHFLPPQDHLVWVPKRLQVL